MIQPTSPRGSALRRRGQRGSAALTFLAVSVLMIGGTLGSIDVVRHNIAETRLQNAMDATAISAGKALDAWNPSLSADVNGWHTYVSRFFSSNLPDGYLNSTITANDVTAGLTYTTDPPDASSGINAQYVDISVRGTQKLLSTGFLGIATFPLAASNQVIRRVRNNANVVLALEDSAAISAGGYLNGTDGLKAQAIELARSVLNANTAAGLPAGDPNRNYVGVVPFSAMIRVGNSAATRGWVSATASTLGLTNYVQGGWLGCITEPPPALGTHWTAATPLPAKDPLANEPPGGAPSAGKLQPTTMPVFFGTKAPSGGKDGLADFVNLFSPSYSNVNFLQGLSPVPNTASTGDSGWNAPTSTALDKRMRIDRTPSWGPYGVAYYVAMEASTCPVVAKTQFLTDDITQITNTSSNGAIDTLTGNAISETMIPGGLLWAWRMLSDVWRTSAGWGTTPAYDTSHLNAIVLVSTGLNSTQNTTTGGTGQYAAPKVYRPQTAAFKVNYSGGTTNDVIISSGGGTPNAATPICPGFKDNAGTVADITGRPVTSLIIPDGRSTTGISAKDIKVTGSCAAGDGSYADSSATIGWGGTTSGLDTTAANAYMLAVCQNIRASGIRIYTIYLGNSGNASLMNQCASPSYAYNVPQINNLNSTMNAIVGSLTELRLTQ